MLLNCDIGERGAFNETDIRLMDYIDIANIACGGHAGDSESVSLFRKIAEDKRIKVSAHISYPDRINFGRSRVDLSTGQLLNSLDEQFALLPVNTIKFHGALYNDSCVDARLSKNLTSWLAANKIEEIITMPGSELANSCEDAGITVFIEAFAERGYRYDSINSRLHLVPRTEPGAVLSDYKSAAEHASMIISTGMVRAALHDGSYSLFPVKARTLCLHSDSIIALRLAKFLHSELRKSRDGSE